MSSGDADIKTVAGHPKARTIDGMRVSDGSTDLTKIETESSSTVLQTGKGDELVISGAPANEKKDYPTDALKHMQNKPTPKNEPKHVQNNSQQNRNIHQPR